MTLKMPKIFIPAGGTDDGVVEWARQAEDAGVDGVFVGDHVTFYGSGSDGADQARADRRRHDEARTADVRLPARAAPPDARRAAGARCSTSSRAAG